MLTMDAGIITYRENPLPWPLRIFIAVLAVGTGIGIPAAWLANVSATTPLAVLALVAAVTIACAAFGLFLMLLVFVSTTELRIDPSQPDALRLRRGPVLNDSTAIPRRAFGLPAVTLRDSDDGPFPVLTLPVQGRRRIEMACFDSHAEAEAWRNLIARALAA